MERPLRIAVAGVTGLVGEQLLSALVDAGITADDVTALASERSEGEEVAFGDDSLEVEKATPESFRGIQLALLGVPSDAARTLAGAAQAAGAWVIDVSAAFRADAQVPLASSAWLAQPTPPARGRIVRVPAARAAALERLFSALRSVGGLREAMVTALCGAASVGRRGIASLEQQTAALLSGREPEPGPFAHRLAFNLVPQVGDFEPSRPVTTDEAATLADLALLMGGTAPVELSSLYVPTFFGELLNVTYRLETDASVDALRDALSKTSRVKVLDAPAERVYPMPLLVANDASVLVGRVRVAEALGARTGSLTACVEPAAFAAKWAVDAGLALARGRV
jgi:aspartate-semialdehyde dehydrogenase